MADNIPTLRVAPGQRTQFDNVAIHISDLTPGAHVALELDYRDRLDRYWASRGEYFADASGVVDISSSPSVGGTYEGADINGLFWSMRVLPHRSKRDMLRDISTVLDPPPSPPMPVLEPERPITITVKLYIEGRETEEYSYEQHPFVRGGVTRAAITDTELRGVLYSPNSRKNGGVLVIGGSEGGIGDFIQNVAACFATNGFPALALGYFGLEGLPEEGVNIDIEYFERALKKLRSLIGDHPLCIWGVSKGAEAVLLIAAHFPDLVDGVIAWMPGDMVTGGVSAKNLTQPMWRLNGRALDYVNEAIPSLADMQNSDDPHGVSLRRLILPILAKEENYERFAIPVDRITCPVFLVTASADEEWPCDIMAERIVKRMRASGPEQRVEHFCAQGAGHHLGLPHDVTTYRTKIWHPVAKFLIRSGGTPALTARAAPSAWRRTIEFMESLS